MTFAAQRRPPTGHDGSIAATPHITDQLADKRTVIVCFPLAPFVVYFTRSLFTVSQTRYLPRIRCTGRCAGFGCPTSGVFFSVFISGFAILSVTHSTPNAVTPFVRAQWNAGTFNVLDKTPNNDRRVYSLLSVTRSYNNGQD